MAFHIVQAGASCRLPRTPRSLRYVLPLTLFRITDFVLRCFSSEKCRVALLRRVLCFICFLTWKLTRSLFEPAHRNQLILGRKLETTTTRFNPPTVCLVPSATSHLTPFREADMNQQRMARFVILPTECPAIFGCVIFLICNRHGLDAQFPKIHVFIMGRYRRRMARVQLPN